MSTFGAMSRCGASISRRVPIRAAKTLPLHNAQSTLPLHTVPAWRAPALVVRPVRALPEYLCRPSLQMRCFAAAGATVEEKVPGFGAESITEGTVMEIKKKVGDGVAKGEIICIIETDKVTVEVNATESGTVTEVVAKVDDTVEVGATVLKLEVGDAPAATPASAEAPVAAAAPAPVASSPEIDLSKPVVGFKAGLLRAAAIRAGKIPPSAAAAAAPAQAETSQPPEVKTTKVAVTGRGDRRVPMTPVRKMVAKRLKDAQEQAALLTTFQEVDMTEVLQVRSKYKDLFEKTHGAQLGFLSMLIKASALALQEIPGINAVIDETTGEIVYRDYCDISVPIPSPRGMVSVTIEEAHAKSVKCIETDLAALMTKARKDELTLSDMVSPTFGITDSGSAGGMLGTAIINPPASALMGTNAVTQRAAVVGGKVVARPIMYTSLTYDHKLIDGRESVTFLVSVRDKMEDPIRMLLDL